MIWHLTIQISFEYSSSQEDLKSVEMMLASSPLWLSLKKHYSWKYLQMEEILGQLTATFRKAEPDTPSEVGSRRGTRENGHCINVTEQCSKDQI